MNHEELNKLLTEYAERVEELIKEKGYHRERSCISWPPIAPRYSWICRIRNHRMPLKVDSISPQDRDWLSSQITSNTTPEQVQELAHRLLARMLNDDKLVAQAEIEVRRLVTHLRDSENLQEQANQSRFYQFGYRSKHYSPEHRVFSQLKVHEKVFPAFCTHFGLSESAMKAVASGERFEHKGWVQGAHPGNLGKKFAGTVPNAMGLAVSCLFGGKGNYQPVPNSSAGLVFEGSTWWSPTE
jgi:hypothetical protein